ncbi:AI-2E family transporter, partial [Aestuariibaculum lutulentum]
MEPRVYERGLQWLVPTDARPEFARTLNRMGVTLRKLLAGRLLGMAFEGAFIFLALAVGGVPMALLLGIIAGVLAFIPYIGAIFSGVL